MALERIAFISVHASPLAAPGSGKAGGMNVYVRELAQEIGRRDIAVDIYTRRQSAVEPEIDLSLGSGVRVISVPAGGVQPLAPDDTYTHLSQFTAGVIAFATRFNLRYDMVYSHYWLSGWVAHKLNEVWNIPFAHMFHTLGQMKNRIAPGKSVLMPDVRVNVEMRVTRWAHRLIAATSAEQLQLLWLYRADRRKILVIPPGVNTDRFYPVPRDMARAALGISPATNLLLFVGRLEPLKGVDSALTALALLREHEPLIFSSIRFIVIGGDLNDRNDAELARLRALVSNLNLEQTVEFLGVKGQELLPCYYAMASAVIMPSDYESFGMVALEAMASGTPVIASEVGGLAFLVRDGETGFLIPVREPAVLADRIGRLLSNDQLQQMMRSAAVDVAHRYSWPLIADQLLAAFAALVDQQRVNLRRR
jgi:D-inositol-3-phosphate glycosyltransferase